MKYRPIGRMTNNNQLKVITHYEEYTEELPKEKGVKKYSIDKLIVETNIGLWDADENSQNRIANAIVLLNNSTIETLEWKMANNTIQEVTVEDLIDALKEALLQQTKIWIG